MRVPASLVMIIFLNLTFFELLGQEEKMKRIYQGVINFSDVSIFRRIEKDTPFFIQTKKNKVERLFYVIRWKSDVFSYVLIEKKGTETFYYPLGWADLESISIEDLKQRSKDILGGKIPRIEKSNL